jgi:hypothetical protein
MTDLQVHDFEVTADEDGRVQLPEALIERLKLTEGDLLAFEPGPLSVRIDLFRDVLADNWRALAPEIRSSYLFDFLRRPLAAIGPGGTLALPPEVFPRAAGEGLLVQVVPRGLSDVLYLYRSVVSA